MTSLFIIEAAVVLPLVFVLYVGLMGLRWQRGQRYSPAQYVALTALVVYALVVASFVLLPLYIRLPLTANLDQFVRYERWRFAFNVVPLIHTDLRQFMMNVALFVPLGVLLPVLWVRFEPALRLIWAAFVLSVAIEVIQVFLLVFGTGRSTDIDDVIANTLGAAVGYVVFLVVMGVGPLRDLVYEARLPVG